jgi:hypothetical protein
METYLERARKVRENQCLHLGQTGFRYGRPNRPTNASEVRSGVLGDKQTFPGMSERPLRWHKR